MAAHLRKCYSEDVITSHAFDLIVIINSCYTISIGLDLDFKVLRTIFGWKDQSIGPAQIMIVSTSKAIVPI